MPAGWEYRNRGTRKTSWPISRTEEDGFIAKGTREKESWITF